MCTRRLKRGLMMLMLVCLTLAAGVALADEEDRAEMQAYWGIVGNGHQSETLALAMDGAYAELTAEALKAVTKDDLLQFAVTYKLPVSMARYAWYTALAECLPHALPEGQTGETLALFLAMKNGPKDKAANEMRKAIRRNMTEAELHAYAAETGLPAGFLAWLMLDDEWHEPEWDDGDDWREDRKDWSVPDWADVSDLRDKYGREAVVTEDDVERVLRQNGIYIDD